MAQWFYRKLNEEVGPVTSKQLVEGVRKGQIEGETLVRKDDSQWVPANEVAGLFDAAEDKPSRLICPYCGHAIDKPPTRCGNCSRDIVVSMRVNSQPVAVEDEEAKSRRRTEEIEQLRSRVRRREIMTYGILLAAWILLVSIGSTLVLMANSGRIQLPVEAVSTTVAACSIALAFLTMALSWSAD